jgi:hypothetical protein
MGMTKEDMDKVHKAQAQMIWNRAQRIVFKGRSSNHVYLYRSGPLLEPPRDLVLCMAHFIERVNRQI